MDGVKLTDFFYVTDQAQLVCTQGSLLGVLRVLPGQRPTIDGRQEASVRDNKPLVNLTHFGICAVTQKPCTMPSLRGWQHHSPETRLNGSLALLDCSVNLCGLGGVISIQQCGQPVPYVSTGPIDAKKLRYNERMALLEAAEAQLANEREPLPAPPRSAMPADATRVANPQRDIQTQQRQQRLAAASARLRHNNLAVERAKLSDDSYNNDIITGRDGKPQTIHFSKQNPDGSYVPSDPPEGWRVKRVFKGEKSGMMAVLYSSTFEKPPRDVLVFRGTDADTRFPQELKKDAITDAAQGTGFDTEAYKQAAKTTRDLRKELKEPFDIAGHSLGGGQASQAGLITGYDTYTFNSAGLHENSMARAGITPAMRAANERKVQAYYSDDDPLNSVQDNNTRVKLGLKALTWPIAPVVSPILDDPRTLPPAVGVRHELKNGGGHWISGGGHSIPPLVEAIEKQKEEDITTLRSFVPLP